MVAPEGTMFLTGLSDSEVSLHAYANNRHFAVGAGSTQQLLRWIVDGSRRFTECPFPGIEETFLHFDRNAEAPAGVVRSC
jgi:hypothetical protein